MLENDLEKSREMRLWARLTRLFAARYFTIDNIYLYAMHVLMLTQKEIADLIAHGFVTVNGTLLTELQTTDDTLEVGGVVAQVSRRP